MSSDLRTELNDCDNVTGFAGDGNSPTLNTLTGQRYEGSGSIDTQHTNSDEHMWTTQLSGGGATFNIDMSDRTIYLLVKDNLVDTYANGGVQITIGDGTDDIGYDVGGNDAVGLALSPFFNCYKLDVSVIVATPGSNTAYAGSEANLDQTQITRVGYGSLHLAKAQGNVANVFLDRITHIANGSYALRINGGTVGTPETMADVQGDDVTNGWGMVANPLGDQYVFFAPTEWGEPAANADAFFEATDEQWFWVGDNGGGRAIGAGNFPFRVVGNATDTISFVATRVTIVNTGTAAEFDLSSTDVDTMTFTGCVFTSLGAITLQAQDAGNKFFSACVFNACGQVDVQSMDMDDCTFNGSSNADGAILLTEIADTTPGTMSNMTFNSDGTGHAVEIAPTGAGPFTFDFDNWLFNDYASDAGTATDRAVYINPATSSADITINIVNGGDTPSIREAAGYTGTVTINNAVTVSIAGLTEGAAVKVVSNQTVGTRTKGEVLFEGLADANGEASFSISYESAFNPDGLEVWVRMRSSGLPNAAIADDGGVQTDETTAANSSTTNDMTLTPAVPAVNDAYYFGHSEQFPQLKQQVSTGGADVTLTWEYWNGSTWAALSGVVDGTSNFENTGVNYVSWTTPGDWAKSTENSQGPFYFVRARVSAVGGAPTGAKGRFCSLDVTRYLPDDQKRNIESTGLLVVASWNQDTIATF